jgi:hypothetical protein
VLFLVSVLIVISFVGRKLISKLPKYTNEILAGATALLAIATMFLAGAANRQLRIMENDQRPWVKVDTEIADSLVFWVGGPAIMPLRFVLANVGKSPAFNVRLASLGYLIFVGHNDPHKEQHEKCEWLRDQPLDNPARGSVLFPGDRVPWDQMGGAFTSGVAFSSTDIQKIPVREDKQRHLEIWIIGCADYIFGEAKLHHQTGFIYQLAQIIPREGMQPALTFGIVPQGTISPSQLRLFPSPSSGGQTD